MTQASEAIREYAKANGWSIDDVAANLGIGRSTLFNKMRGTYKFTLHEGYCLAKMLGCSLEDFYEMTTR